MILLSIFRLTTSFLTPTSGRSRFHFFRRTMSAFAGPETTELASYLANHMRAKEIKEIVRSYTLCDGTEVEVKDYSVIGHDDRFYGRYGYNTLLHRGTCEVTTPTSKKWVFGLPKFGNESSEIEAANQWIFTEKANGECGHIAMIDADHVVIGSKNVHLVVSASRAAEDLTFYESKGEERLSVAIKIARLLYDQGLFRSPLLSHMLANDLTLIVEACFDNHIVRYSSKQCVATCFVRGRDVLSPADAYAVCEQHGFPHVEYDIASTKEEFEALKAKYQAWERDSEGAVVYARGADSVFTLYKVKHPLYVVKRASRELIKRRANHAAWTKRMDALHVQIPEACLSNLLQFYAWLLQTRPDYTSDDIQEEFGKLFSTFESSGYVADDPVAIINGVDSAKNTNTLVLGLCGIPGSGKSHLRNVVVNNKQYKVGYANQDELHKSRKKFVNALKSFSQQKLDILVVDKSNINDEMRSDVYKFFTRVYWVVFDDEDPVQTCWQRIKERGVYHPSLVYSYAALDILKGFDEGFERPTADANVISVQIKDPMDAWIDTINQVCSLALRPIEVERTRVLPHIKYWMISLPEHQHVTLAYAPSAEDTERLIPHFGEEIEIVTEVAYTNGRVKAAPVLPHPFLQEFCHNAIPHITLWTADGAEAFESNAMLANTEGLTSEPHVRRYRGIVSFVIK